MAILALILRSNGNENTWVPSVVNDIVPGDVYRLIVNGVPSDDTCKALGVPVPVLDHRDVKSWQIEHEIVQSE
mgnify:CR=1 FL=1